MDYQALFEAGTLTPQQLFEWMKVDRNTAAAALKQRPELQKGLMEVLSRNSTARSAEQNQPQSAYSRMQQKSDDLYGAEEDDSFLEGVGKGLLDVPVGAARIGGAIADYGKAGFNELTGNEEGLQWEDTPDLKDVAGDVFQTGLAAVTGGAGPAVIKETGKKVVQNLAKGGITKIPKNILPTANKIKNKLGNTATGKAAKVALGGPKRQLAAGLGVAGGLGALDNEAPEAEQDITNTAPQEPEKPLDQVDLDTPIAERGPNGEVADPAANQNLDNPNGQMAMTPEGQAQAAMQAKANNMPDMVNRLGGSGSKMGNLAKGRVQAQANFMADDIIKAQKKQSDQNSFLRDRYDATGGRRAGAWDRLSEAQKDEMVSNYRKNSFYDSNPNATGGTAVSDIARAELGMPSMEEQRLADLDARVEQQRMSNMGYGVAADPENYQGALPSMPKEDFSKKSGMQNEGTGIVNTTLDGKGPVTTLEMGGQFDKAGGLETAKPFLSPAQQVNLERQLDRPGVFNDQFGQEQEMSKDTVRMTSDEQDYSDANFQNRDDALAYLNRGASLDEPAPEAPTPEGEEEEEGGWNWSDAAKGAGLIGGGLLLSRTKPGRKMIQKGFDMFGKKNTPNNPWASTRNMKPNYSGRTPQSVGSPAGYQGGTPQSVGRVVKVNPWSTARNAKPAPQPQANPWASTGNMRPPASTPQSVGRSTPPAPQANPWASTGNMRPNYSGGTPQSVGGPAQNLSNPWASTGNMRPNYSGGTPQSVGGPTQNLSNPWASTGNMRPRAATPQDAGFNARIDAMNRQDLARGVGSPRTADGRRVATTEELRRLYRAMNQQTF